MERIPVKELTRAIEALTVEMRVGFEKIHDRIDRLERVTGMAYDELTILRERVIQESDRTGQRIQQIEHVAQATVAKLVSSQGKG